MSDAKKKLIQLLCQATFGVNKQTIESYLIPSAISEIADQLMAADVVIPVRCGKCRHWVPEDSRKDFGCCHCFGNKRGIWRRADGYCDRGDPGEE